jgi:hypothetical protein
MRFAFAVLFVALTASSSWAQMHIQAEGAQYRFNVAPPDGQKTFGGVSAAGTPRVDGHLNRLFGRH